MSSMYGRYVREYIGVIAYIFLLGTLAMQVKALSVLFFNIFGYKSEAGPIAAFLIIIAYTSIKGVTGVIKTDILQLFIFIIILLVSPHPNNSFSYITCNSINPFTPLVCKIT